MKLPTTTACVLLFCALFGLFSCNNKAKKDHSEPNYIPRNWYFVDSYNGVKVYRDNISREPLDGYFIVGDEMTKWEEFHIKEGLLYGDYVFYHQNGQKFMHSTYNNGKLHGEERTYFPSGKIKKLSTYTNGILNGKVVSYFENGKVLSESQLKDNKPVTSITYNDAGEVESKMFIEDGKSITQSLKNGKVFKEQITSTYDSFKGVKFYNDDNSMKIYLQMIDEGQDTYLVELNEEGQEIKRINFADNPKEISKYRKYISSL